MSSKHTSYPVYPYLELMEEFDHYIDTIPWQLVEEKIFSHWHGSQLSYVSHIESLKAEARFGLTLIYPYIIQKRQRILEIGSGSGLLANFLASKNIKITALEPGLSGFSINILLSQEIKKHLLLNDPDRLHDLIDINIASQDLNPEDYGKFDLIYSVNVLEHIPQLKTSLLSMQSVLKENGVMIHTCPNYHIPYEPHFGILTMPFFPQLTTYFFPSLRKIEKSELWNSLNFITSTSLRNICRGMGCKIRFQSSVMYNTFLRLDKDPAFRSRQKNSITIGMYSFLKKTGLIKLLKYLPPDVETPMIVLISK